MRSISQNRTFVIVGIVACNLFVWLLAGYFLNQGRLQYEHEAEIVSQNIATAIDQTLSNSIEKVDLTLRAVANHLQRQPAGESPKSERTDSLLAAYKGWVPDIENLRVTDAAGIVIHGNLPNRQAAVSYAGRDYFPFLRDHADGGLQISAPLRGLISQKWVIVFVRRYNLPDGQFGGVVTASIPLRYFNDLLSRYELGPRGGITLRSVNLAQIARYPESSSGPVSEIGNTVVSPELRKLVRSGVSHATYHTRTPIDHTERMLTFHRLSIAPMIATVGLASEDYLTQWRKDVLVTFLLVGVFLVFSLASSAFLLRNLNEIGHKSAELADANENLRRLVFEQQQTEEALKSYAQRLITLEEDLRHRVSMELHDDVGQELTALGLNLAHIGTTLHDGTKKDILSTLKDSRQLTKEIIRSVRNVMVDLRPWQLDDYGLTEALGSYAEQYAQRTGLTIAIEIEPGFPRLSAKKEIALFRITQEALNNIAKYASATKVAIALNSAGDKVRLSITDNGRGFNARNTGFQPSGSGWGLTIMRERAKLFGGSFQLDTEPGVGTSIAVEMDKGEEMDKEEETCDKGRSRDGALTPSAGSMAWKSISSEETKP